MAFALAREGVNLVINARSEDALQAAAESIRAETGVDVIPIAADITTEAVERPLLRLVRTRTF